MKVAAWLVPESVRSQSCFEAGCDGCQWIHFDYSKSKWKYRIGVLPVTKWMWVNFERRRRARSR
jgi:hypothetical protein